jgi:hypothetical protein
LGIFGSNEPIDASATTMLNELAKWSGGLAPLHQK